MNHGWPMVRASLFCSVILGILMLFANANDQTKDAFAKFLASAQTIRVTIPEERTRPQEVLLATLRKERINFVLGATKTQGPEATAIPDLDKLTLAELITRGNARNWFRVSMTTDTESHASHVLILPPAPSKSK